jgi:addiction module RelE/StbE family toxin
MRKLIWSNTFVRLMKRMIRKHPQLRQDIEDTLNLLVQDAYAPQLHTHKLKGKLEGCWACSVGYDLRIVL